MPSLDFLTLYIVIFLNSLTVCVVWAAFAYRYRPNPAALHWLFGMALSVVGGAVLAIQGNEGAPIPAIIGNAIIILGFGQFWIGLRRFQNQTGGQLVVIGFAAVCAVVMIACYDFDRGRAMVYAAGQGTMMGLCIGHLLRYRQPGIGCAIAALAFAVALLGQMIVIASNASVLIGTLQYPTYYALASYALLCTVFSGVVWNLGFALMMIERLQDTLSLLSETDDLTGVANRRGLQRHLMTMQEQARAAERPYALALFDLNDFKALNDKYGHAVGDQALAHFGQVLASASRPNDLVARWGGDEFCVLFPNTANTEAIFLAESLRARITESSLEAAGTLIQLSASVGVATCDGMAELDLIAEADKALYKDKALKNARTAETRQGRA